MTDWIDIGTLSSRSCDVKLTKILNETKNPKIIRKVTNIYHEFRHGLRALYSISDLKFRGTIIQLWYNHNIERIQNFKIPEVVITHLMNSTRAFFREEKRKNEKLELYLKQNNPPATPTRRLEIKGPEFLTE